MRFLDGEKDWVRVVLHDGRTSFVPSLHDFYLFVQAIITCEREKHQGLPWDAANKVRSFLIDCCSGMPWEEIRRKHQIPDRQPRPQDA